MNTADFSLRHIGPREADQKQMLQTDWCRFNGTINP